MRVVVGTGLCFERVFRLLEEPPEDRKEVGWIDIRRLFGIGSHIIVLNIRYNETHSREIS